MIICQEIRKVKGGYILELRWPYGGEPSGYGEVICTDWGQVLELLTKAANEEDFKHPSPKTAVEACPGVDKAGGRG